MCICTQVEGPPFPAVEERLSDLVVLVAPLRAPAMRAGRAGEAAVGRERLGALAQVLADELEERGAVDQIHLGGRRLRRAARLLREAHGGDEDALERASLAAHTLGE